MKLRAAVTTLAAAALACAAPAASAVAGTSAGTVRAVAGDAGFASTARHLGGVETYVWLPDASRFSRELGSVSVSIQLWSATRVLDLRATACTDASCKPGGRPAVRDYRLEFDVYNRATRALICSTARTAPHKCPGFSGSWNRQKFRPGVQLALSLIYPIPYDNALVGAASQNVNIVGQAAFYTVSNNQDPRKPDVDFDQARLGVELGSSPWAAANVRAPESALKIATSDRPVPPPYFAEIVSLRHPAGGIAGRWWGHHAISARTVSKGAAVAARPGGLFDDGYGFTVFLES
jgi:hypothetical protein